MLKKNLETRRRQQQTWRAGFMSVHGIVVSYAVNADQDHKQHTIREVCYTLID
jgi:hypothetical protein